ncbi:MAG TPA: OmpA family protein [Polyangiaceae bacterium]|jgi:chemotaxis protein MotB|nr:OmpA family protein [Polyangiaceae bacterium]
MNTPRFCLALLLLATPSACVSQGKYDRALQDAQRAKQLQIQDAGRAEDTAQELARQKDSALALAASLAEEQAHLRAAQADAAALQKQLDDGLARRTQLEAELNRVGKSASTLTAEKGALAQSLDQTKRRLEELRKAQAAAEQRAALFRELALKLRKMVDAGELKISLRDGRMVLQLPNEVLFDSGRTDLKPAGKDALSSIAQVLKTIEKRQLQVAGHTDNVPIQNSAFASNWELSCARALAVVHFLIAQGVPPDLLSAAGYGPFDPAASNDNPTGRQANRRTEIVLQPNIDELVAVPETP